jgi:glycosyltransferase involved in cell wall biosynthesis
MEVNDNRCPEDMRTPISVVILTYNEEKNIENCLKSIYGWVEEIFIVDSYSTDKTLEIVTKYTDKIYQHPFENHSKQFNWALNTIPITTEWIMRLDADERVTPELRDELLKNLPDLKKELTGLYVKRKVYFMGTWIKHGGYYPTWLLRIWKKGKAHCEDRWMDEHIKIIEGEVLFLKNDIIDENQKNLHWWIGKHNSYATREAVDILNLKYHLLNYDSVSSNYWGSQEQRKRWIKEKLYANMPLFMRPFFYFFYRYFIKFGFLEGKEGLMWHFLQGFWYRFLVDAKIFEIYKKTGKNKEDIKKFIKDEYGINFVN